MSGLVHIPRRPKAPLLDGMARLVDLGTKLTKKRRFKTAKEADAFAIQSDWNAILNDWNIICQDAALAYDDLRKSMESPTSSS